MASAVPSNPQQCSHLILNGMLRIPIFCVALFCSSIPDTPSIFWAGLHLGTGEALCMQGNSSLPLLCAMLWIYPPPPPLGWFIQRVGIPETSILVWLCFSMGRGRDLYRMLVQLLFTLLVAITSVQCMYIKRSIPEHNWCCVNLGSWQLSVSHQCCSHSNHIVSPTQPPIVQRAYGSSAIMWM